MKLRSNHSRPRGFVFLFLAAFFILFQPLQSKAGTIHPPMDGRELIEGYGGVIDDAAAILRGQRIRVGVRMSGYGESRENIDFVESFREAIERYLRERYDIEIAAFKLQFITRSDTSKEEVVTPRIELSFFLDERLSFNDKDMQTPKKMADLHSGDIKDIVTEAGIIPKNGGEGIGDVAGGRSRETAGDVYTIFFSFGGWKVNDEGKKAVNRITGLIREEGSSGPLLIEGFTDSIGGYNDMLAKKRAIAVAMELLVADVVDPDSLYISGRRVPPNVTYGGGKAGGRFGRRVDIILQEKGGIN